MIRLVWAIAPPGRGQAEAVGDQLHADRRGDRAIDQPHAVLAVFAGARQAVEQADPHEVAGAFGIADQRLAGGDRAEPRPAGGHRERADQQPLPGLARCFAQTPDHQGEEQHRGKRVAPEGDQRVHAPLSVNFTDMATGVAKFYK